MVGIFTELFINFWFGCLYLLAATSLGLIKGYNHKPRLRPAEQWNQVTPDEFNKVIQKQKQMEKWDLDLFDASNPIGKFSMDFLMLAGVGCYFWGSLTQNISFAYYLPVNIGILLAPHWLIGTREYLKKDELIIKNKLLQKMLEYLSAPTDFQVLPMMSTSKSEKGGDVPMDVRLMIRALNAPKEFLGLQIQVSINNVQGTSYPYLYCALVVQKDSPIINKSIIDSFNQGKVILEKQTSDDVEVLVIRQKTTKTSGYHTDVKASRRVIDAGLDLTRKFLEKGE